MPTIITRGAGSARGFGFAGAVIAKFSITAGTEYNPSEGYTGTGYCYPGSDYYFAGFGSATPSRPSISGRNIDDVFYGVPNIGSSIITVTITGFPADPGQNWFKSITIGANTYLASAGIYAWAYSTGDGAQWTFTPLSALVNGNTYAVTVTR